MTVPHRSSPELPCVFHVFPGFGSGPASLFPLARPWTSPYCNIMDAGPSYEDLLQRLDEYARTAHVLLGSSQRGAGSEEGALRLADSLEELASALRATVRRGGPPLHTLALCSVAHRCS